MKVALIYDFDGTLSPGNMQEYKFIPDMDETAEAFWKRCQKVSEEHDADPILTYMSEMIETARAKRKSIRREAFVDYGKEVKLFEGVQEWFDRINAYAAARELKVEHYINSSGLAEMIEGTPIFKHFKRVFASSFFYDPSGVAHWPAVAVNYTNKTQFIFKINKGITSVADATRINQFTPESKRPIPFRRMIYIGDGTTDIPCMRLIKEKHGHAIAVYDPAEEKASAHSLRQLIKEKRVNFVAAADYSDGGRIDRIVKTIIDKIATDAALEDLSLGE